MVSSPNMQGLCQDSSPIYLRRWAPTADFTRVMEGEIATGQLPKKDPSTLHLGLRLSTQEVHLPRIMQVYIYVYVLYGPKLMVYLVPEVRGPTSPGMAPEVGSWQRSRGVWPNSSCPKQLESKGLLWYFTVSPLDSGAVCSMGPSSACGV